MDPLKWWQTGVFYQIYPRSFADSNGDGIGDLPGIIARLDYLKDLGIDGIWLSPHYPSPLVDCGYDIADYTGVAKEYGTLGDFRRFLDGAHDREIRVILDLVLNHTSDQHTWFLESRSSRDNPKSDWYIWRDGKSGGPPNNWVSAFGGSAWEYDARREQYYYHYFFKEQPDLNWRNPDVKESMYAAMRFWLDMGVDGFRLDAIGTIFEDPALPDHRSALSQAELYMASGNAKTEEEQKYLYEQWRLMFEYQADLPDMHDLMRELRKVTDEYEDRVLVGETEETAYCAPDELHMVFNFPLTRTERLTADWVRQNQQERLAGLAGLGCPSPGAWPCNTLGNHDSPRVYSQFGIKGGSQAVNDAIARQSLALMLTLRGTPFLYNGEEIGMADLWLQDISQFRDTWAVWQYSTATETMGMPAAEIFPMVVRNTRDKCRTPMQWSSAPNAGFSPARVQTWLPVHSNYTEGVNVADQSGDGNSLLNFYRRMLRLRRETPALIAGDYIPLSCGPEEDKAVLAFLRSVPEQTCLVALNMHNLPIRLDRMQSLIAAGVRLPGEVRLIFSSHSGGNVVDLTSLALDPYEIFIAEVVR